MSAVEVVLSVVPAILGAAAVVYAWRVLAVQRSRAIDAEFDAALTDATVVLTHDATEEQIFDRTEAGNWPSEGNYLDRQEGPTRRLRYSMKTRPDFPTYIGILLPTLPESDAMKVAKALHYRPIPWNYESGLSAKAQSAAALKLIAGLRSARPDLTIEERERLTVAIKSDILVTDSTTPEP